MEMEAFNNNNNNNNPSMITSPYTTLAYTKTPIPNTLSPNSPFLSSTSSPYTLITCTTPTTSSSSSSPWMDSRIWCRLPQQILDRVIAFLPPPSFFRSRSVCKRWYSLLYSPSFLQLYLHLSPIYPHWFLFFPRPNPLQNDVVSPAPNTPITTTEAYLFDPYSLTWFRLTFPLIPAGFSPTASSSGLVCWASDEPGPKSIFLHNPLHVGYNNSITQLPPTLRPRLFPSIGFSVANDHWSSLDVVLAGDDMISPYAVKNLTAESFRVEATRGVQSAWSASPLPRLCSLESSRQMTYCRGRFYCMSHAPYGVLCYDVAGGAWNKIQAPMRRFLRSPSLVESGDGEVALVAAVEKSKLSVPRSLRVWRLCGAQWVEVERMPQQMYAQFEEAERRASSGGLSKAATGGFDCVGHGEFIVIVIRGVAVSGKAAVLFDARRKRWMWMPPCPFVGGGGASLQGFAYEPRLATPVTGLLDHHFALPNN